MSIALFLIVIIAFVIGSFLCFAQRDNRLYRVFQSRSDLISKIGRRAKDLGNDISSSKRHEQTAREIFSALSLLRNLASVSANGNTSPITTDALLEQLAQNDGLLKNAYLGALRLLRTGRSADAADFFTSIADVGLARDFIMLILEWDEIPPERLLGTIATFRNAMKETRTTELLKKNEVLSDIVYLPVVVSVLIVFVNFIYIAYFAEQRELLTELFY